MATITLFIYAMWLICRDICHKITTKKTPKEIEEKKKDTFCEFSQDEIFEFEELIELDKD